MIEFDTNQYDNFTLYDGTSANDVIIEQLKGHVKPRRRWISTGLSMYIEFSTASTGKGFVLQYEAFNLSQGTK